VDHLIVTLGIANSQAYLTRHWPGFAGVPIPLAPQHYLGISSIQNSGPGTCTPCVLLASEHSVTFPHPRRHHLNGTSLLSPILSSLLSLSFLTVSRATYALS
jgi:hypothetical protein